MRTRAKRANLSLFKSRSQHPWPAGA